MARSEDTLALLPKMQKASTWLLDDDSRKMKDACTKFGVPYGTFWMVHERNRLRAAKAEMLSDKQMADLGEARLGQKIERWRASGDSWGTIMARLSDSPFGAQEGTVRRAWTQRTGLHNEGTRVAHGGRFLGGAEYHEVLYRGQTPTGEDKKATGTKADRSQKWEDTIARLLAERNARQAAAAKKAPATTKKAAAKRPSKTAKKVAKVA